MEKLHLSGDLRLAYLAGLFDGEGSITILNLNKKAGRHSKEGGVLTQLVVELTMTNLDAVRVFQEEFGGKIYIKRKIKQHHRTAWIWKLTSQQALEFLVKIEPFLFVKRRQCALGKQHQIVVNFSQRGKKLDASVLEWRKQLAFVMHAFNS